MSVADFPREIFKGASKGKKAASKPGTTGAEEAKGASTEDVSSITSATSSVPSHVTELPGSEPPSMDTSTVLTPSVTVSSADTSVPSAAERATDVTSPGRPLTPQTSLERQHPPASPASPSKARPSTSRQDSSASGQITLETAIGAGKGVGRIVETGMKTPMNFCMGLARGFRNAPRLYNDDTVRREEKVTDFASGLKVAGKEFGLGLYDGISGLVTQPLKGAEKEGAAGLLKGFGKGIGGLVLKGGAAVWSVPAYAMKGIDAEIRNRFSRSSINYIIASRVSEGEEQLQLASVEEQKDIIVRWRARRDELKGFYSLRQKEKKASVGALAADPYGHEDGEDVAAGPPKTGWFHTRNMSLEERKELHARKEAWKRKQAESGGGGNALEDEEFDRAIRASVQQTSRGDREEDERVEQAIRASVREMRRIAEQSRDYKAPISESGGEGTAAETQNSVLGAIGNDQDLTNVSDEEYQALVEEAVRQSIALHGEVSQREEVAHAEDDEELRRAIEASKTVVPSGTDDEDAIRRAIEESERAHRQQLEKEKTEDEIVLEFVKKQSLAEEEYRRNKDKGKRVAAEAEDEDMDEDLRRALEESLKVSRGGSDDGPSGSGPGAKHV